MASKVRFSKYQGAGNDFILVDNRDNSFNRTDEALVKRLCDRRFGIGADGLMLLQNKENYDFEMIYYNADGREGSMCGNGGRCIVAFAHDLGVITDKTAFLAVDGVHHASLSADLVNLQMIDVREFGRDGEAYILQTGSPHYVSFVTNLKEKNVFQDGFAIRNNATYAKEGINVNFIEKEEQGYFLRTFERGVEDETYACGTGATAAAMAVALQSELQGDINIPIRVLGGQLYVSFHKDGHNFTEVFLKGPAQFVFEGLF
ncbi:diaminopimelate epimerase [Sphingobacterium sp. CZ-UAM]|jgi:diaminopimelate epimerase|uniref:diaminopimelate epimerase n=1 Tax=unclassified Sphingobacterium TaxID=2609468 RepID=UPI0009849953|nr:diaminopimelate epimerase [Sphingobacterium sp. CZ-UAM]OOG17450.1 diaminopimelate epimerase [Sphingobacterium sp. CZ-UAM]